MASEKCSSGADTRTPPAPSVRAETAKGQERASASQEARTDAGTVLRLSPDELARLAPRLRPYLRGPSPAWPDIVEAADWLRHDLGVSKALWGDACLVMGREQAAVAIAIVSAKPVGHFTSTPGGYFKGMVDRARAGTLNLSRTVWGMRGSDTAAADRSRHSRGH